MKPTGVCGRKAPIRSVSWIATIHILMKTVNQYTLAMASNGDHTKLIENVNKWILEGFKPFGNLVVIRSGEQLLFCQAMVKNKIKNKKLPTDG
jgi:hypothetical protein